MPKRSKLMLFLKIKIYCLLFLCSFFYMNGQPIDDFTFKLVNPSVDQTTIEITATDPPNATGKKNFKINGEKKELVFQNGVATYSDKIGEKAHFYIQSESKPGQFSRIHKDNGKISMTSIPLWMSMLPPLIAILLALIFKEVLVSLFVGIWMGAFILNGFTLKNIFSSLFTVIDTYIVNALADKDHLSVVIFSLLIGGMVAIISRNGGMRGVVDKLSVFANNAKNTQLVTWFLGCAIFFDDYANTLIVGNTMRPVTDSFRISREKLAYLVDSTAAPIAAIAFVTTWIGAELGYISEATKALNIDESAYSLFLNSLTYSFYPVLTLIFMLLLIFSGKDFGPMYTAEHRARTTGELYDKSTDRGDSEVDNSLEELDPVPGIPHHWYNALIPVLIVVLGTIIGLFYTGHDPKVWANPELGFLSKLSAIIGGANSYAALLWSSLSAIVAALVLTIGGRLMSLKMTMETFSDGLKTMLPAILILVLAWSLGSITKDLHTADFLTNVLDGFLSPNWMPTITFILAGLIAFSTGSSWSTMAILYPLMLPATWTIAQASGMEPSEIMPIFYNVTSCVLAGSVFGDHCSPISDTTILSSLASSCNHLDHVKTQIPYALTVGTVSLFLGTISMFIAVPNIVWFALGAVLLYLAVKVLGKTVPDAEPYK